ncbi:hypothetical protein EUX98_g6784 [Antrodiella citrinella]|uniref:Xylanolytic transcriptional activator regulatory domain-containing protein n=1 Tax=Antrodiella citrinella TaxID=2447956 RepID=A0A4S4MQ61_9APHY|nr:hypothetical protein EUX98_g6784 [Antrodiella citrinella]
MRQEATLRLMRSLSAGQGTRYVVTVSSLLQQLTPSECRFILADTDQLHRKIGEMSERIRQLEDALAIFQSGVSSDRHPLLRDELLSIKFGPEVRRTVDEEATRNKLASSIDALGTLTVGEHGETKFIGRSGGSETLFLTVGQQPNDYSDSSDEQDEPEAVELDDDFENMSITFPLTIVQDGTDEILRRLEGELPPRERAWALCEAYLAHFSWLFRPVKREELINEILSPIYKTVSDPNNHGGYHPKSGCGGRCPHLLAVLFNILALGALVDLTLQPCSAEAEKYYRLGRASLSLRSILDSPEFETVQAVSLMAAYHSLCSSRHSVESAWSLASLACKLAQALGLRKFSFPHPVDTVSVAEDDVVFGILLQIETVQAIHCMALGRPPAASRFHVDCALPADEEASLDKDGETIEGFWHWKLAFARSIIVHAHDLLLAAEAPDYEMILDLDRKIRELCVPKIKLYPKPEDEEYYNAGLCMQSCLMSQFRSVELDLAVDLFKKGAGYSKRARQALPMLIHLRGRATQSYQRFRNRHISPSLDVQLHIGPEDRSQDRLAIFGGQTRVMSSKLLSHKPPKVKKSRTDSPRRQDSQDSPSSTDMNHSSSPEDAPTPSSESGGSIPQNVRDAFDEVHPALVNYLSLFPSSVALVDTSKPLVDLPMSFSPPPAQTSDMSSFASPFLQSSPLSCSAFSQASMMDAVFPHVPQPFSMPPTDVHMQQSNTTSSPADSGFAQMVGEDGTMDSNGWFSGLSGLPRANTGYAENMPLGGDHAMLDEQWMSLMRDTGLLTPGDTFNKQQQNELSSGVTEGAGMFY